MVDAGRRFVVVVANRDLSHATTLRNRYDIMLAAVMVARA
jgi:hypothetical protein